MQRRTYVQVTLAIALGVLALRVLLAAAGGTGGFVAPEPPPPDEEPTYDAVPVTDPAEGGWVWFGARRAIRNVGETIAGYITGTSGGDVKAIRIDNATREVVETTTLYDHFQVDDHDPPSFVVRPDGVIMTAFAYHLGPLYVGIGTTPGALPAQAQVTNITSQVGTIDEGAYGYTYATILYLEAEDRYYIFARYHDSGLHPHLVYTYSDDDGATWAAHTVVQNITYHQLAQNGSGRIDFVTSDHPLYGQNDNPAVHTSIYHLYYESGTGWHKSDGTSLTPVIGNTAATLVYDGTTSRAWLWDIAIGEDGHPRIVYVVYDETFPSGDWHYEWARWTGSAWDLHEVADAGGTITVGATPEHGQDYAGGIVLDHEDPNVVWYSSNAGGTFQVYRAVTADNGATWAPTAITDDADKNVRPVAVVGHAGGNIQALALYGTYSDYFNYSQGIKVLGTPATTGDWFGLPDPWASRPEFGTYDEATGIADDPGDDWWISGDQGGRIIEQLTFSSRPAGHNVIVLDNVSNLTIRDCDFDEVPECIYAEGGGENVVIERIRARNIFGPYTRTAFHSGNLIQWKNPGPFTARDLKVKQDDPNPGGADWGTEDIISLGGDTTWGGDDWDNPLLIERFAFDGGDWQSPSGTGFFVGDGDLIDGDGGYVWLRDGILLNPGQCAIGTGEQGPYRFQRIDIQGNHGGENAGFQIRSADVEVGDCNVDWPTDAVNGDAPAYTDLGGNDFDATLSLSVEL